MTTKPKLIMIVLASVICCVSNIAFAWPKTLAENAYDDLIAAREAYDKTKAAIQNELDHAYAEAVAQRDKYVAALNAYNQAKVRTRKEHNKVLALYRAAIIARDLYGGMKDTLQKGRDKIMALRETYVTLFKRELVPPAEYDHPYTKGPLEIIRIPVAGDRLTEMIGPCRKERLGCAQPTNTECKVYIVADEYIARNDQAMKRLGIDYNIILRHEVAHCNGWPYDHPGAKPFNELPPNLGGFLK